MEYTVSKKDKEQSLCQRKILNLGKWSKRKARVEFQSVQQLERGVKIPGSNLACILHLFQIKTRFTTIYTQHDLKMYAVLV